MGVSFDEEGEAEIQVAIRKVYTLDNPVRDDAFLRRTALRLEVGGIIMIIKDAAEPWRGRNRIRISM